MRKYISVNKETMAKLRRIFGKEGKPLCERAVKNALDYSSNSTLAKKIRFTAKRDFYGVTYVVTKEEDMISFHDSDSLMHQVFSNGAELYYDTKEVEIKLYWHGDVIKRWGNIHISEMPKLWETARAL